MAAVGEGALGIGEDVPGTIGGEAGDATADDRRDGLSARGSQAGARSGRPFGDLPYGPRMTAFLPTLHRLFLGFNCCWAGPALRLGLGRYLSNPITGYMMLLRTTGRRSGLAREAPLAYVVVGDAVYCTAGFGRRTHWLRNILADPRVEVVLPDRSFTGLASEVTDPDEIRRVVRPLAASTRFFSFLFTGIDPGRAPDAEVLRVFGTFPVVRIQPTGIAAGPNDPGGAGWLVSSTVAAITGFWLIGRCRAVIRATLGRRRR